MNALPPASKRKGRPPKQVFKTKKVLKTFLLKEIKRRLPSKEGTIIASPRILRELGFWAFLNALYRSHHLNMEWVHKVLSSSPPTPRRSGRTTLRIPENAAEQLRKVKKILRSQGKPVTIPRIAKLKEFVPLAIALRRHYGGKDGLQIILGKTRFKQQEIVVGPQALQNSPRTVKNHLRLLHEATRSRIESISTTTLVEPTPQKAVVFNFSKPLSGIQFLRLLVLSERISREGGGLRAGLYDKTLVYYYPEKQKQR